MLLRAWKNRLQEDNMRIVPKCEVGLCNIWAAVLHQRGQILFYKVFSERVCPGNTLHTPAIIVYSLYQISKRICSR